MFWIIGGDVMFLGLAKALNWGFLNALMPQFRHVPWEGFRFYDLIMPLFLFIVGAAMPFSFAKRSSRNQSKKSIYLHVIKRVAILFFLAMMTQGNLLKYRWSELHIFIGTLPAIGVGYLVSSILLLELDTRRQIMAVIGLLLSYWALMMLVPVPGYGAGVLTPKGNLATWVDHTVMRGFFPESRTYTEIVTTLTYGSTVMLGVFGGKLLKSGLTQQQKVIRLVLLGAGTLLGGLAWSPLFPVIKHIWTSSFVLLSGGICYLLLALFYYVIDVKGYRAWAFGFKVIGMNAIAVYVATHIFDFRHVGNVFVGGLSDRLGVWNGFVEAAAAFAVVWLILYWMYRKKTFIKI